MAMDLGSFKLLKEDSDNYHVMHPKGKSLVISKKGIKPEAHKAIQAMKAHYDEGTPDAPVSQADIPDALKPQMMDPSSPAVPDALKPSLDPAAQPDTSAPDSGNSDANIPQPASAQVAPQDMLAGKDANVRQALEEEKGANTDIAKAKADSDVAQAKVIDAGLDKVQALPTQEEIFQKYQQKDQDLMKAYQSKTIDPNRYYNNQSIPSKIMSGIGLILGGFASGINGQPNPALGIIKDNIDRDILAQKNDQDKSHNLWMMNRQQMGDDQAATLATQNQMYTGVKYQMEKEALRSGTPIALAQAKQQNAAIDQKIAENNYQLSLIHQGLGMGQKGSGFVGDDPSILIPQLIKEPGAQKAALDEVSKAQNVAKNGDKIMSAFDQASKDNTVLKTGAGLFRTPGSVMALHQLMLPNFKSIDGTVRQAAMDESFHNLTPSAGDTDAKIAEKRQALQDWLHSESAAPTAKAHGIDLSKFSSTAVRESSPDPKVRAFLGKNPGYTNDQAVKILQKYGKI